MNKLEEDYTYIELQRQLKSTREQEDRLADHKQKLMHHINAIKRDYLQYELDNKT